MGNNELMKKALELPEDQATYSAVRGYIIAA